MSHEVQVLKGRQVYDMFKDRALVMSDAISVLPFKASEVVLIAPPLTVLRQGTMGLFSPESNLSLIKSFILEIEETRLSVSEVSKANHLNKLLDADFYCVVFSPDSGFFNRRKYIRLCNEITKRLGGASWERKKMNPDYWYTQVMVLPAPVDEPVCEPGTKPPHYTKQVTYSATNLFGKGPSHHDDVYTIREFIEACGDHAFVDGDGHGHPIKLNLADPTIYIFPSWSGNIPPDATHVVWYNR